MYRKSTLFGLLSLWTLLYSNLSLATTYVDNGSSATYTLNSGDSLSIASGTFTGSISSFATGAKIAVQSGAVFQPSSFPFPDIHGTLYVYGTFKMNSPLRTNTSFTLKNYGIVWITSTTLMSGSSQQWTNYYGSLIKFDGDATMTNNNNITNLGTIDFGANFTMTGTSTVTNKNTITVSGNYLNSGGTFSNEGKFQTSGSVTFNNGLAIINNYCRMIAEGGINNTTGFLNNYGFMWAKASLGLGNIVNSGTIVNGPNGIIKSVTLNNTGTIKGAGYMYFTGNTVTTSSGTTGDSSATTDTIKFYDATRTNASTIYDSQTGTVNPNVLYQFLGAPDSNKVYFSGCAVESVADIPLPVKWNYFFVTVSDKVPMLKWSAEYDPGTIFQVQRSFDGINFYNVEDIKAETTQSEYGYNDLKLAANTDLIYYRIKAVEPTGATKFTKVEVVRFSGKNSNTVQLTPNPFKSSLVINYWSSHSGITNVRLFNSLGQQEFHKNFSIAAGSNTIVLNGISLLPPGIYFVQVSQDSKIISTGKVVKE